MWRVIGCWLGVATLILVSPSVARSAADAQPEVDAPDAIVCQLLADCASPAPAAAAPPAAAPGGGRVARARGFTFQDKGQAPAAPASPQPGQPAATGQYDLRVGFMFASADMTQTDRARTAAFALALRDPRIADRRIRIEGYTDSIGSDAANLDLSRRRARAVGNALVTAGIDSSRLDLEGYGARRPLPGIPADSGANRRVIASLAY